MMWGGKTLLEKVTSRGFGYITAVLIIAGIVGLELTAQSIVEKMKDLRDGRFHNSMWIVSQIEVDFQKFLLSLHVTIDGPTDAIRQNARAEVGRNFDIYVSRIGIVSARARNASNATGVATASNINLNKIKAHLKTLVPLMDHSAGQNADYFRRVLQLANSILPELRRNTMASLQDIIQTDAVTYADRASVLGWLLILTRCVVVFLCAIAVLVWRLSWQLTRRTVDLARVSSNLNKAIETSLDAVVITDKAGRISTYNSAAETMFGFTFAKVKGVLIEDLLNSRHPTLKRRRLSGRQVAASLARSANRGRIRLTLQKNDGASFIVEVAVASDVDSDGAPIFLAFLRDISKLVEADAFEHAARLEAERSAAANARFLAVMSHEMRTPLHGIIAALELLDGDNSPKVSSDLRKVARDCAGSALEQIEEVLELALHDAVDVSEVILTFFPLEVARIIVEQSQSLAAANHTALVLTFDPVLSEPMLGNRRAFRSALANLIGNAIKFTKNGHITVNLIPSPDIGGSMRVEVRDTGIGIEPHQMARIFEDFETVSDPEAHNFEASGLGLGIVRRAVGLMGGVLRLTSTFGQGSCFWFDIPQRSALLLMQGRADFGATAAMAPALSVLVVDDNAINRLLLAQMLERLGHRVDMATDGVGAVDAAGARRYDLILMDINMPEMNGVEATRKIRAGGINADVPIMGVTANAHPTDLATFVVAGLNCTLIKPITSGALALQIRDLMRPNERPQPLSKLDKTHPLVSLESFQDLRDAMARVDFLSIVRTALGDASLALAAVSSPSPDIADQIHQAAGSAAMIGAKRLHMLLCALEDASRAGQQADMTVLLEAAIATQQDTDAWFRIALSES